MFRIIGGTDRSRPLKRVASSTTRESADSVKEAVFNLIGQQLSGVIVDLFAGSGAYGLEALSRGANYCYFFDNQKKAIETITDNVKTLKRTNQCLIMLTDYQKAIGYLKTLEVKVNYLFLDPPYSFTDIKSIVTTLSEQMVAGGLIIIETKKDNDLPDTIDMFIKIKERNYGIKKIIIYRQK